MKTIVHNYHELYGSISATEALNVVSEIIKKRDLLDETGGTRLSRCYYSAKKTMKFALRRACFSFMSQAGDLFTAASDTLFNQKQILDLVLDSESILSKSLDEFITFFTAFPCDVEGYGTHAERYRECFTQWRETRPSYARIGKDAGILHVAMCDLLLTARVLVKVLECLASDQIIANWRVEKNSVINSLSLFIVSNSRVEFPADLHGLYWAAMARALNEIEHALRKTITMLERVRLLLNKLNHNTVDGVRIDLNAMWREIK